MQLECVNDIKYFSVSRIYGIAIFTTYLISSLYFNCNDAVADFNLLTHFYQSEYSFVHFTR